MLSTAYLPGLATALVVVQRNRAGAAFVLTKFRTGGRITSAPIWFVLHTDYITGLARVCVYIVGAQLET